LIALRKSSLSKVALWLRSYLSLSSTEKDLRHRALQAYGAIKDGKSLTEASRMHGIGRTDVVKHLGKYLFRRGRRWFVKKTHLQRARWMFSKGKRITIIIDDDDTASLISRYLNAVKFTLRDGDVSRLHPYKKLKVIDINNKKHPFETDLATLQELDEAIENSEFLPIYDDTI